MDLNYLYHRQQVSLVLAERAACAPSRAAHQGLARLYGGAIAGRKAAGVADFHRSERAAIQPEMERA